MGNQNSGRKPLPTALKVLRGNPGQRRLKDADITPPAGEVVKPEMSDQAGKVWDRVAPICLAMGTLTTADVEAFKVFCGLQATLDMADLQKNAPGFAPFTLSEDYNGAPKMGLHAAIKLEKEFAPVIRPYYDYFGLNPLSRAKIQVPKKAEPVSKWEQATG